jgi:LuxR family maltose regulon positive regulatory protein
MARPLLATKLYVPPVRPRLVPRQRLVDRIKSGLHRKLTLVSAPAGFGKTTLLSECTARFEQPVAWLALDEADNDPARFLTYLVAALQTVEPGVGSGALGALQAARPPGKGSILELLVGDLVDISTPFILVLDDYHTIEAESVHDTLTFMVDHQPPQMHLVILTRTDPPLPIARLRGRGQVTELRQNDLRFSYNEAAAFLSEAMGLQLSGDDVAMLSSRTEGWIAGLQMAAVSMQGREDPAGFVQAFAGSHRHILDYLMEEVLEQQPAAVQAFLLRTSILNRLRGSLCDAIMDRRGVEQGTEEDPHSRPLSRPKSPVTGQEMLEYLERANLFVVSLDHDRRWYRYHHLFADLLRQRLKQSQPNIVPELHHRASLWFEQNQLTAQAIDHAVDGQNYDRALGLIEAGAEAALKRSELATLQGWLEALPAGMVRTRPLLCIYHTWGLLLSGSPVEEAEARLQQAVDADHDGSFAGEVLAIRSLIATYQRKIDQVTELSRRALELIPDDRLFFRSLVAGFMGYNALYTGDLVAARQALTEAMKISQRAGNLMNQVLAMSHLGDVCMFEVQLREARDWYESALALSVDDQGRLEPIAGVVLIGLGQMSMSQYRLQEAEEHLAKGSELVQRWGKAGALGGYIGLAQVKQLQGDLESAHELLQKAETLALQFDAMQADDVYVATEKARLGIRQGDLEAVEKWFLESGLDNQIDLYQRTSDGSQLVPFNRVIQYLTVIHLHLSQGRPDEALRISGPLRQMVEAEGWMLYALRLLVLEAIALHQQDHLEQALERLERALSMSEPDRVDGLIAAEGAPMAALLRHANSKGIFPAYASKLLALIEAPPDEAAPSPEQVTAPAHRQPLADPLTERELEVLRLLASPLSTSEIAERLFISVSTVRSHTKSIYGKLNAHRRLEATERAEELNLI